MSVKAILLTVVLTLIASAHVVDPAAAQATRTWVSGVGDDANPCSRITPCKTFAGAISKTAPGGEIDCLDPGGFGAVTITKAITIDCTGTFGSVLVAGTNAIIVSAGTSDRVMLRGLNLNGLGSGLSGIRFLTGAQLSVDKCFVAGFTSNSIDVELSNSGNVFVTNSYITGGAKGIFATATALSVVTVSNTSILRAPVGFEAQANVVAMLTDTSIASAGNSAVTVSGVSQVNIDDSTLIFSAIAISTTVSGALVRISDSNIYGNGTNFNNPAGATVLSTGDNRTTPTGGSNPTGTVPRQ
jgi:hypothetical protein